MPVWQADDRSSEPFQGLLLLGRGRTGLTQRGLAARAGVSTRSVQDWESGVSYPSAEGLRRLIAALLEVGGLSAGREAEEARAIWAAVERAAPRMHAPFDPAWFAGLRGERAASAAGPAGAGAGRGAVLAGPGGPAGLAAPAAAGAAAERRQDWGEAPDVLGFVGRADELGALRRWILDEGRRLVALLGMGGVGKTSLAARLAQAIAPDFERVYWRSLRDAPPVGDWLAGAIGFLSDQELVPPAGESEQVVALLRLLRVRPCLLVLDNFETLFEPGQGQGRYRAGLGGYGRLLGAVGEAAHRSCLLLTSREAPVELTVLGGDAVRPLQLGGLGVDEARAPVGDKRLTGDAAAWADLVARYAGNGLALRLVGESIRELFGGDIAAYLEYAAATSGALFGGLRQLLESQIGRLSDLERGLLRRLAVEREPVGLAELAADLGARIGRVTVLEAVEGLRRRSLLERTERGLLFGLHSVVLEYVTDQLVEDVTQELASGEPDLLLRQPLLKATAKEYVRRSQERLIGAPLVERLVETHGSAPAAQQRLLSLLNTQRGRPAEEQGYGPGNLVNLLRLLRGDLQGVDLSRLAIRQAYLQDVEAQGASMAGAHLSVTVLAQAFHYPTHVALSADGTHVVAATSAGEVCLWRIADRMLLATLRGHTGAAWSVALSAGGPDGRLLASAGLDGTVRLWDPGSGRLLATLNGHTGGVNGVALSADGRQVASGGHDRTVRLWDATTAQPLATLEGHTAGVNGVALSGDGRVVASGSWDGTVRLWDAAAAQLLATLRGHTGGVRCVALGDNGQLVASGSYDGTVKLWGASTGQLLATLQGHRGGVWGVAVSRDGGLVASASYDGTVKLWETESRQPIVSFQGRANGVWGVATSRDGRLMASACVDGTVKLWDRADGRLLAALQGHLGGVWAVALSADGLLLASGSFDGTVRLWDPERRRLLATLGSHSGGVRGVAISADGRLVASGGFDGTVKLWETPGGRLITTLPGHAGGVWGVAISEDGMLVASGGYDEAVRLWEAPGGRLLVALRGHAGGVRGVALSGDRRLVASSGIDETVRVWDVESGRLLSTLSGHLGGALDVALSGDGHLAASGSEDEIVRLWDVDSGTLLATMRGHTGQVYGVAFVGSEQLASGSIDGTVRLWQTRDGACVQTLRAERRYERMDITGLTGITEAQRGALLALGAVDRSDRTPGARDDARG
jgi:WD40 repeat protein/transcriptional regulator with XRE-family HTH domain